MKSRFLRVRPQRGFTLVEIAIVLVIVGLLVGGILKGQEMITSARVRNIIEQKESIQTAYFAFIDRYKKVPGDLSSADVSTLLPGASAVATNSGAGDTVIVAADSDKTFQNMAVAGFLAAAIVPANPFSGTLALYHAPGATTGTDFLSTSTITSQLVLNTGAGISSSMLAEVDRKADDGVPNTGGFRFSLVTNVAGTVATNSNGTLANCAGSSGSAWIVSPANTNCVGAWLF